MISANPGFWMWLQDLYTQENTAKSTDDLWLVVS